MSVDLKNVKKQFEKSMNDYDKNALVQDLMASKMIIELSKISSEFDNILELGAGTGLLTKRICSSLVYKNFYANDLVEKSKMYVSRYVSDVNFLCGNALKIKPQKKMDLIVSNAMFQWFDNLEKALEIIRGSLKKEGILAFSTFGPSNYKQLAEITGLKLKYQTKSEIEETLVKLGFEVLYCEEFYETLQFNSALELLAHMKHTGVNSLSEKTWTVKKVKDFCDKFNKKYKKVELTYAPIIVVCKYL
ncbi:MAG: malonyl-ACP O-methyltransferase BioC [Cyanobacteria bacterium SIG26]|nr:malonyl-ACP O-methyltransferase BioC [Cyanobacteria bacterium SIG26]